MKQLTSALTVLMLAGLAPAQAQGAPVQFKTDFSGGIPPQVELIDRDMNTPATAMQAIGFEPGVAWVGYFLEEEQEHVACSTSWYKPSGTSDDWMILPAISVEPGATLRWRAKSSDKKYFDGFAVYASTRGTDPDVFDIEHPLFAIDEQPNEWTDYCIDLSAYVGQDINIAFVNNSTDRARLYIDDILAGTPAPLLLTLDMPGIVRLTPDGSDVAVRGIVASELDDVSVLGDVVLTYGSQTITVPNDGLAVGYPFEFSTPLHVADTPADASVAARAGNGRTAETHCTVWPATRPVLAEEFTGTWCAWCVRGIVYMEALKEHYGDRFVPLCVHIDDVMSVPEYTSTLDFLREPGIPNAIANRKYESDPALLYENCEQALNSDPIVAAFTEHRVDFSPDYTYFDVCVGVTFAQTQGDGDYSLQYILAEDNINVPGDARYFQKNAYSGGAAGEMGGFEDMPAYIDAKDMWYHDVVRAISDGGTHGIARSLPGDVSAGRVYYHTYCMAIPDEVLNPHELAVVAVIRDNRTGEALNVRRIPLGGYFPTGVENLESDDTDASDEWYRAHGSDEWYRANGAGEWYTIDGRRVLAPTAPGLYLTPRRRPLLLK